MSADSIVPNAFNPQDLNRFSYVRNNPLRYTDPTGHMLVQDGPQQDVFKPSVFNAYVPQPKPPEPEDDGGDNNSEPDDPWEFSQTVTEGVHLGPTAQVHFPDYNDDDYNGMPWASGPLDDSHNFFIAVNVYYNQSSGIHMSDILWSNQYDGLVILDSAKINDQVIRIDSPYLLADGVWNPISGSGGDWDSDTSISINVNLGWIGNAGNGPFPILVTIPINVPSLNQVISFLQP